MAIVVDESTTTELLLNYMLFAGAIFQLVCIFAVILIPQSAAEKVDDMVASTEAESQPPAPTHKHHTSHDHTSRKGRKDRKKHR
ncbi:hypothetical protein BsWGS_11222 [Bradybaena similaris]